MTNKRPTEHQQVGDSNIKKTNDSKDDTLNKDRTADSPDVKKAKAIEAEKFSMEGIECPKAEDVKTEAKWRELVNGQKPHEVKKDNSFMLIEGDEVKARAPMKPGIANEEQKKKINPEILDSGSISTKAITDQQMAFYKETLEGVTDPALRTALKAQATMFDKSSNPVPPQAESSTLVASAGGGEEFTSASATLEKYSDKQGSKPKIESTAPPDVWKNPPDEKPIGTKTDGYGHMAHVWNKGGEYHVEYKEEGNLLAIGKLTVKDSLGRTHTYEKKGDGWHIDGSAKVSSIKDMTIDNDSGRLEIHHKNKDLTIYMPGGRITEITAHHEKSTWPDGRVKYGESPIGSTYVKIPGKDGGYTEFHKGPRADDAYQITHKPGGKLEIREGPNATPYEQLNDPQINAQRKRLNDLVDAKIANPEEKSRFLANMARFENRENAMEQSLIKQGLSPKDAALKAHGEIAKTYSEISRLLEAKDTQGVPVDAAKRIVIAEQIMRNAATPTIIDQGSFNTCNVAALEMRTYTKHPGAAAKLVVDMATDGKYTFKNEKGETKEVKINKEAYEDFNDPPYNPPGDKDRSLASQVFQVTAVNVHYVNEFGSHMHYEQHRPKPNSKPQENGELLRDDWRPEVSLFGNVINKGLKENHPGIDAEKEVNIGKLITGDQPKEAFIKWSTEKNDKFDTVSDEKSFKDKLAYAKAHGLMPITVQVHCGNEPFLTDSGAGSAGGSTAWHVVSVTDFTDGAPPMVTVDNQWGKDVDRTGQNKMTLDDLYFSMRLPDDKSQIKELEDRHSKGTLNPRQELELDRHKFTTKQLSVDQYENQIKHHLETARKTLKGDDYNIFIRQFQSNINDFKPEERFKILEFAMNRNLVDNANFEQLMKRTMGRIDKDHLDAVNEKKSTSDEMLQYKKLSLAHAQLSAKFHAKQQAEGKHQQSVDTM